MKTTAAYRIIGRTSHPARFGKLVVVDAAGVRCHYADTRAEAQRWIGSMRGVLARQQKQGKGQAA